MPNRYYGYYDADPTQPPGISSLPHAYGRGTIGTFPTAPESDNWHSYQSAQSQGTVGAYRGHGKVRGAGAIGEFPSGSSAGVTVANSAPVQQKVAKLKISSGDSSSGSQQSGALQVYRKPEARYGQVIGQYNLQPSRSNVGQMSSTALQQTWGNEPAGRAWPASSSSVQSVAQPLYAQSSLPSSRGPPASSSEPATGNIDPLRGPAVGSMGPAVGSMGPAVGNVSGSVDVTRGSARSIGSIPGPQSSYAGQTSSNVAQQAQYHPPAQLHSQHSYQHQPLIGRMPTGTSSSIVGRHSSSSKQQLASPFIPASTSGHPITSRPLSRLPEDLVTEEMMPHMSTGNLSALESISQFGSLSQTGSGEPTSQGGGVQSHPGAAAKVKAVCSSGGHFVKLDGVGLEYEGGETRLVQIPNFCQYQELLEALERLAGFGQLSSGESSDTGAPSLKYQLPSEPNVYVDLVDDTDTELMFDEWHDYTSQNRASSAKLHLFVDWLRCGSSGRKDGKSLGSATSMGQQQGYQSAGSAVNSADGQAVHQSLQDLPYTQSAASPSQDDDIDKRLKDQMEVIGQHEVTLVKFLGSGGYGEVYLGKWQHCEAAVKCLNPSLFFNGGTASKVAKEDLLREAAVLGSLRHPNVVWVYGIVLSQSQEDDDCSGSENSDEPLGTFQRGNVPQNVRPPAIITEYMSQGSVKTALQRNADIVRGALMRLLIAMDAAKGMEYLHSKNIVHFDLKSANLLLGWRDKRAICKVADFGLSKQKRETFVSNVSSQRGTLPWIAPEIIKNPKTVNEKVDVFSFGVVLWELWVGKEPYDGLNYHALYHQMTTSDKIVRPCLPGSADWDPATGPEPAPGYQSLMERCWSESPYGRPSFNQIVKALKEMASSLRPSRKPTPSQASTRPNEG